MIGLRVTLDQVADSWHVTYAVYRQDGSGNREWLGARSVYLPLLDSEWSGDDLSALLSALSRSTGSVTGP